MTNPIKRYSHDPKADAVYITLSTKAVAYTKSLDDTRIIDYDAHNNPIGIELLCVSNGVITDDLPLAAEVAQLLENKHIKIYA